jgi:hypothetical protein
MKGKREQRKKGFKPPFSRTNPKKINKGIQPKMSIRKQIILGKGQGNNLCNVGDVRGITYIGITLTKEK